MKRIKVIIGYAASARFHANVSETPIGYIPRQPIPSPYSYGPSHVVWNWTGRPIIIVETRHRRYEVFAVPPSMIEPSEDHILAAMSGGAQ